MSLRNSSLLWTATVLLFVTYGGLLFLPVPDRFAIANALTVSIGVAINIAYLPGLIRSFRADGWERDHYFVLGVWLTYFANNGEHIWRWVWRLMDKPEWLIDHSGFLFMILLMFVGGVFVLSVRGAVDGDIPRRNWIRLGTVIGFAVFLASFVIFFIDPTGSALVER